MPEIEDDNRDRQEDVRDLSAHFCQPCDVETMARRLNLDKRRVQQLAKGWPDAKNDRGEYVCPRMVYRYSQALQNPKRSKASGLVKKQEESLEIRNARDRAEVLADWETMVQRKAVNDELAPLFLAVRNGMRQISHAVSPELLVFIKTIVEQLSNGEDIKDYEIVIKCQKLLSEKINESLSTFSRGIAAWADSRAPEDRAEARVADKAQRFWDWAKKRFV